jgi:hypothetical protein
MISTAPLRILLAIGLAAASAMGGQDAKAPSTPPNAVAPSSDAWSTKTFDLKYLDPEQVRRVFAGQSHVMDTDRELKVLTARGSPAFLKEVEDTIKRLDVAPPTPANTQITVYLLATAPQAPTGAALPTELSALAKEVPAKLADMQMFRVREGQAGETTGAVPAVGSSAVSLSRVRVDSSSINPGAKGDIVSLNGLRIWINVPQADGGSSPPKTLKTEPDVAADIDLTPNEAVVVAKVGIEKPLAVVVRVGVVR